MLKLGVVLAAVYRACLQGLDKCDCIFIASLVVPYCGGMQSSNPLAVWLLAAHHPHLSLLQDLESSEKLAEQINALFPEERIYR